MVDSVIETFFLERKAAWLKKNIKPSMDDTEAAKKQEECDGLFSLENWLPNAAKRARQMSLSSHPCTFSHPSARKNKNGYVTPVNVDFKRKNDGLLRSGNAEVEIDALGNAAALDVYKFLTLEMTDSCKLIDHIKKDSGLAVSLLTLQTSSYEELKCGLLAMLESDNNGVDITSSRVKQVYFPVEEDYHQFSLLCNSGMIFEMKKRIETIRFSDEAKDARARKRKMEFDEQGFAELYNLTTIGYGGTKPQNISVLNNKNGGKAYLLSSMPPILQKRNIRFPKFNFFKESFPYYEYRPIFDAIHKLFKTDYNNIRIREGRDYRLQELLDRISDKMWAVRAVAADQYRQENSKLKPHQRIWLCDECRQIREEDDAWLDKLCKEVAGWTIRTYERLLGHQAIKLGESERLYVLNIVNQNREVLR